MKSLTWKRSLKRLLLRSTIMNQSHITYRKPVSGFRKSSQMLNRQSLRRKNVSQLSKTFKPKTKECSLSHHQAIWFTKIQTTCHKILLSMTSQKRIKDTILGAVKKMLFQNLANSNVTTHEGLEMVIVEMRTPYCN